MTGTALAAAPHIGQSQSAEQEADLKPAWTGWLE